MKRAAQCFQTILLAVNVSEAAVQEEKLCDDVGEIVKEVIHLDEKVGSSGGCEAAVTARRGVLYVAFVKCGELLCGKRFSYEGRHQFCVGVKHDAWKKMRLEL